MRGAPAPGLTLAELRRRLNGRGPRLLPTGRLRPSAVLVPILQPGAEEPLRVLFTLRSKRLRSHAGQVSFPGGRVHPGDRGRLDTATREAAEEIGLPPSRVEELGRLDDLITISGYHVRPYVGLVSGSFAPCPEPSEVAEVFTVALDDLIRMEPEVHGVGRGAMARWFRVYRQEGRVIWGATAAMLHSLLSLLDDSGALAHEGGR